MSLLDHIVSEIRSRGPLTVAEFMERALYHPELGYYTRAQQRSGRDGDFFTSVDVGPLFGEAIAAQLAEMWEVLKAAGAGRFDVVEAGAGNGRLARDVMDAAAAHFPDCYSHIKLTLVERSAAARAAQPATLGPHMACRPLLRSTLPPAITGVIFANELLDAFPVHVVTRTTEGHSRDRGERRGRSRWWNRAGRSRIRRSRSICAPRSAEIPLGARIEVGLAAAQWIQDAAHATAARIPAAVRLRA